MKIELRDVTVAELAEDYEDFEEKGVVGYGGSLDIRPPYQREFIYKDKQRDAVIDTLTKYFPLNVMYWAVRDDGTFEVIDGQQRTISICQYVVGEFAMPVFDTDESRYFHNLQDDERQQILDYELQVYVCDGTGSERLEWFRTINIAGEKLTNQELRNAVYAGSWVSDAKRYFSKSGCAAYGLGSAYMKGSPIRQEYLETAIKWTNDGDIDGYMATHQHKKTATELWTYFQSVISWVEAIFPRYRSEMKGIAWGDLYNAHKDKDLDPDALEKRVANLMADPDVTSNKGAYTYVLTGVEKHLNIRAFDARMRRTAYEQQKGSCAACGEHFEIEAMQADHKKPWSKGGKTVAENCMMLCQPCNRQKWDA